MNNIHSGIPVMIPLFNLVLHVGLFCNVDKIFDDSNNDTYYYVHCVIHRHVMILDLDQL